VYSRGLAKSRPCVAGRRLAPKVPDVAACVPAVYGELEAVLSHAGVGPYALFRMLSAFKRLLAGGPISRLLEWLLDARASSDTASPASARGDSQPSLLPMHLPRAVVLGSKPPRNRVARRSFYGRRCAAVCADVLVAVFDYYELGCPKNKAAYTAALGGYRVSSDQELVYNSLVSQLVGTCSQRATEEWSRGRKTLFEAVQSLKAAPQHGPVDPMTVPAQPVKAARISMPTQAGISRPEDLLYEARSAVLRAYGDMVLPESEWPRAPVRSCHWVDPSEEPGLRRKLLEAGMAEVIPASSVPVVGGRPVVAGLFSVPHKPESDRLIIDRRGSNMLERRLHWARLPSGSQLGLIRIPKGQVLRGSGDDLSSFFYLLENPPATRRFCAVGRKFRGSDEPALGLAPSGEYYLALRVWAMGDHNSVDVAQACHEDVLRAGGAYKFDSILTYGDPLPATGLFQGIYIDDLAVMALVDREVAFAKRPGPDTALVQRARACYERVRWPTAPKKAYTHEPRFTTWGVEVDGVEGWAGVSAAKRLQLTMLTGLVLALGRGTPAMFRSLVGSYIHPFGLKRCCMCCFGRVFNWIEGLEPGRAGRIPHDIREELGVASLLVLLAKANLRAQVSTRIYCSDATPAAAGVVEATVSRDLAEGLFDVAEHRGRYSRLDGAPSGAEDPLLGDPRGLPEDLLAGVRAAAWSADPTTSFRTTLHINLQECKAAKLVLKKAVARSLRPEKLACGIDSRVLLGAWAKGRSSSTKLNGLLRSTLGWRILGQKEQACFWLASADNPGDDPSRLADVRAPDRSSPIGCKLAAPGSPADACGLEGLGGLCVEIFSGSGRLTVALEMLGLFVDVPVECWKAGRYHPEHDLLREEVFELWKERFDSGSFIYAHFGLPCKSWSVIQQLNHGSRSRSNPGGSHLSKKELEGNLLAWRTAELCKILHRRGAYFSIENPRLSFVWGYEPIQSLCEFSVDVHLDQCMFGAAPPGQSEARGGPRLKKPTTLRTNLRQLEELGRPCDRSHPHVPCLGSVKVDRSRISIAKASGVYPWSLVSSWASLVRTGLAAGGHGRRGRAAAPPAPTSLR